MKNHYKHGNFLTALILCIFLIHNIKAQPYSPGNRDKEGKAGKALILASARTGKSASAKSYKGFPDLKRGSELVSILVPSCTPISVSGNPTVICRGGSSTLTASGVNGTQFSWSTGGSGASIVVSPTVTTTYSVTGTKGTCSDTKTITITVNPIPTVAVAAGSSSICAGSSTSLTASGATSFTWSPSGSLNTNTGSLVIASPTVTTTYSVLGTSNGCSNTKTISVTVQPLPTLTLVAGASSICAGSSTSLTASGAASFSWSPAGSLNTSTGSIVIASPTITTTYSVVGTSNGCSNTKTIAVTVNPVPSVTAASTSSSICAGSSTTLTASGATSFTWSPSGSLNASTGSLVIASPTVTTTYSVTGANNGCANTKTLTITVNPIPIVTVTPVSSSICAGSTTTLTASGAASFSWSPSGSLNTNTGSLVIASPTVTTIYSVTGTSNGCSDTKTIAVTVNPLPSVTVASTSSSICAGSSTSLTASGATSFTWSPSGSLNTSTGSLVIASPSITTSYTVIGTSNGCSDSKIITLTVNPLPTITVNSGSICAGQSFTIVPSGANSYTFSGGSAIVSPTASTSYTVIGTSTTGCVSDSSAVANVTVIPLPVISVNSGSICAGQSFTIVPSGANSYTFSGGSAIVSPTASTSYTVIGTSTTGCVSDSSAVANVTVIPLPVISVNSGSICPGQSFTLVPSGASTYTFSGGSAVVSPTTTTSYTVVGTSTTGCVSDSSAVANVTVIPLPVISVNSGSICAGQSFTIIPSGANTYTFSGGSAVVSPSTTTSYTVIGSNAAGCVSDSSAVSNVTVIPLPVISVNSGTICPGQSFTIIPSGANSYTFEGGSAVVSPTANASYTVIGASIGGCVSASAAVSNITMSTPPIANSGPDHTVYFGYPPLQCATMTGSATGGVLPYQFSWNPGSITQSISVCPTVTTIYTLTVTDSNGCTGTDQTIITVIDVRCDSNKVLVCHNNRTMCVPISDVQGMLLYGDSIGPCNISTGLNPNNMNSSASEKSLTLYPNPNTGLFAIEICKKEIAGPANIEIMNSIGQLVYSKAPQVTDGCIRESVELQKSLPPGVYFMHLSIGLHSQTIKMILVK